MKVFTTYLNEYYLADDAKYNWTSWGQYSTILANGENYSRTSNVSESIHSQLNKDFNRRLNFESVVAKLAAYKKSMVLKKAALIPIRILNYTPKASRKSTIKTSDRERLRIIYEKVRIFSCLDRQEQLTNLKLHLIDIGSQRRNSFRNTNIAFVDNYISYCIQLIL